jgi:transcriptional regulator with XRE-family HTH domain
LISRHAFGSRLRTQRERRGVTLESIVDSTKIKLSLLEALERGDTSQWPRGLFRRAYIRDYACAIGLPAESLVAEFVRLFPEEGGAAASEDVIAAAQEPMRLTFAVEPDTRVRQLTAQAAAAVAELGLVGMLGGIASFTGGYPLLTACGAVALLYYPLATALTGRVLSPSHLRGILKVHPAGSAEPAPAAEPAALYLVPRQAVTAVVGVAADEFPQPRSVAR